MNKKEFGLFASALRTYYPREQLLPNQQAMELWYRELCDIEYSVAEVALRKWVVNNKWSPAISDIRAMTNDINGESILDWGQAWDSVCVAIREYGSYNVNAAMASFDETTRQTVKRMGFKNLCMSENVTADRANFRMIYEQLSERRKKDANIPLQLKNVIQSMLDKNNTMIESNENYGG